MSLRRLILLSLLTVLLSFSVVYALSYEFRPKNSTSGPSWGKGVSEQFGLELTLMLEKTEYSLGEPVNVTLTVTNIDNKTVSFLEGPCYWDFAVYNDTGNVLFGWYMGRVFTFILHNVPLDPGVGVTRAMVWPQTCNTTETEYRGDIPDFPVSPGTYYIVGRYCYNPLGSSNYNLETAPVQVTITQP